jgi:heavy metal efflux system protein
MLRSTKGVTEVLGIGGWKKEYQIIVNPEALVKYQLSINDLHEAIEKNNENTGANFIERSDEEILVRTVGLAKGVEDLKLIVIKYDKSTPITIAQVAQVKTGGALRRGVQTKNGQGEIVSGMVVKLFGENSIDVISKVEKRIKSVNSALPKGVTLKPYYEQKTLINSCIKTVNTALYQGIILVILVLILFIGALKPGIIVLFSIPFSILFSLLAMDYFGLTLNLMTLGGLAIAIGMIVDGTIVIVERVHSAHSSKNFKSRTKLIVKTAKSLLSPIFFSILIIMMVFVPIITLSGVEGKTFRPMALSIIFSMFGSLVYAILIAPVLSWYFISNKMDNRNRSYSERILNILRKGYKYPLKFFLNHSLITIILTIFLLVVGVFTFTKIGSEFTPKLSEGTIVLRLTMAPSISLNKSTEITLKVEKKIMKLPMIKEVVSRIGRGEVGAHTDPVNSAEMYIVFNNKYLKRQNLSQKEVEEIIRKHIGDIPGVLTNFTQPIAMTLDELMEGVRGDLAIKLFGSNMEVLKEKSAQIKSVIETLRGAEDVQTEQIAGQPQIKVTAKREEFLRWGVDIESFNHTIKSAVGGDSVGFIFEGVNRYNILVKYPTKRVNSKKKIGQLLVKAKNGNYIPLSQIAKIEEIIGYRQITRLNGERVVSTQVNVRGRDIGGFVKEAKSALKQISLPEGYYISWGGQFKLQQKANKRFMVVIPVTLFIVILLLFFSFRSIKLTLLILFNIPLALVGGIVALYISKLYLSVPASIGFIALFGIALGNGMVLLSSIREMDKGNHSVELIEKVSYLRIRPVLMTALTTALGLLPLIYSKGVGSEIQKPLAIVVLGGLISSTLLTLILLPSWYHIIFKGKSKKI